MTERTIAGALALKGFETLGGANWNVWMDTNLRALSVLSQLVVLSRVTALPGSPTDGQIYIVPDGAPTNEKEVAVRDAGAWVYFVPFVGMTAHVVDENKTYKFVAGSWVDATPAASVPGMTVETKTAAYTAVLADANGKYIRMNLAAGASFTVPPNASVPFPIGSTLTIEQAGAGQVTIAPGAAVTVSSRAGLLLTAGQFAVAVMTKVAADVWVLTGDLA